MKSNTPAKEDHKQINITTEQSVKEFEEFLEAGLGIDQYFKDAAIKAHEYTDDWFNNYCLSRDLMFNLLKAQKIDLEKEDLTKLFDFLDDVKKSGFIDGGYIDNFKQSIKNQFHEKISDEDMKSSQETIDQHIRPSQQLSGWKFYDRYLSGYLVYLFNHADKSFELRKLYHLSFSIFKQSESTVKTAYKEVSSAEWGKLENTGMAYFLLSCFYGRISMLNVDIDKIKPRAIHKRSEDSVKSEINAYVMVKRAVAYGAVKLLKQDLLNKAPMIKTCFNSHGCDGLLTAYDAENFTPEMPHMSEKELSALCCIVFLKEILPETLYSEKTLEKMRNLI